MTTAPDDARLIALEEQVAHLTHMLDDLSDIVAQQGRDLALATRRIAMLMEREAEREANPGSTEIIADQPPPHW